MIISHKHKFIFVKTAKTAGTSLEIALSKFCGPLDVITPITREDEMIRRQLGFRSPQNYGRILFGMSRKSIKRYISRRIPVSRFYNHMPASEIRGELCASVWKSYYKFTVCRNPWDRMVSTYFWNRHNMPNLPSQTFEAFLFDNPDRIRLNWRLYTFDDRIIVDEVIRFENLAEALAQLSVRLQLPHNVHEVMRGVRAKARPQPEARAGAPSGGAPVVWTRDAIDLIALLGKPEISHFGYAPPQLTD